MAATANGTQSTTHAHGTSGGAAQPDIHLYTNHRCPYAHRAHITLEELGLPFTETIIDLDSPRPQWYLDINPRGLVPALRYTVPGIYDGEVLTESATVSRFLADSFPGPLLPSPREDPTAPLRRARMQWLIDTWEAKVAPFQMALLRTPGAEKGGKVDECVAVVRAEIEPRLSDAAPFYGGSRELTFVETQLAPFVIRLYAMSRAGEFVPASLAKKLDQLPNFARWAKAVMERPSVLTIWDEAAVGEGMSRKYGHLFEKV